MNINKLQIIKYAKELGFCDIAFIGADDFQNTYEGLVSSPRLMLKGAACIIVLFANYLPAECAPSGYMNLSPYYAASNFAYHASKKLVDYIQESGATAVRTAYLPAKAAAQRSGGYIGDNGFYYHKQFGSFVCLQTILTDAAAPTDYSLNTSDRQNECMHCNICSDACPSNAVGDVQNCLRYHIINEIPEALRGDVYQLFGCELCQSACPNNSKERSKPYTYALKELMQAKLTDKLKEIAGTNLVRTDRLISQAVLYAAAKNEYALTDLIYEISETSGEPVRTHALYAYNKLKNGEDE